MYNNQVAAKASSLRLQDIDFSKAVYYQCHEASGATLIDTLGTGADQTVLGTTTNLRSAREKGLAYNADATVANNNRVVITDPDVLSLVDLSAASSAGEVVVVSIRTHAQVRPLIEEWYWSVGVPIGAAIINSGGWGLRNATNSFPQLMWRYRGSGTAQQLQGAAFNPSFPAERTYTVLIDPRDPINPLATMYINGTAGTVNSSALQGNGTSDTLPTPGSYGIVLGARRVDAAPNNDMTLHVGKSTGADFIRSFLIARIPGAKAGLVPQLARDLTYLPDSLPPTLAEMYRD